MPEVPSGLQEAGRAAWGRIWQEAPWLEPADALLVGMVCSALDQRATLQALLSRDGPVIEGTRKTLILHPAARQLRAIDTQVGGWLRSLGLAPVGRRRPPRPRPASADPPTAVRRGPTGRPMPPAARRRVRAVDDDDQAAQELARRARP